MNKPHEEAINPADAQIPCRAWRIWGHSSSVICAVWSWELVIKTMNILKAGLLLERYLINFLCLHEGQIGMLVIIYEQQCDIIYIQLVLLKTCLKRSNLLLWNALNEPLVYLVCTLSDYGYRYCLLICSMYTKSLGFSCQGTLFSTHFPLMICLVVYFSCFIDLIVESHQCFLTFLSPLYPDYLVDMLQRIAGCPYEMLSHISHTQVHG